PGSYANAPARSGEIQNDRGAEPQPAPWSDQEKYKRFLSDGNPGGSAGSADGGDSSGAFSTDPDARSISITPPKCWCSSGAAGRIPYAGDQSDVHRMRQRPSFSPNGFA